MRRFAYVAVAICTLAGATGAWLSLRDQELSERPARFAQDASTVSAPASLEIGVVVPYPTLSDLLTRNIPAMYSGQGRTRICGDLNEVVEKSIQKIGGDVAKLLGKAAKLVTQIISVNQLRHVCQDADFNYEIKREGAVSVAGSSTGLHLEVPVSAEGRAGFSGDVAKALALDHKNFHGSLVAIADGTISLDRAWCPTLNAAVHFDWKDRAQLEITHNVWLNVDGAVGPAVDKLMQQALDGVRGKLTCNYVTKQVKDIWHPYDVRFGIPGGGQEAALRFIPEKAGFSGVSYGPNAASLTIGLGGSSELLNSPPSSEVSLPIPPLEAIPAASNNISLTLPIQTSWKDLSGAVTGVMKDRVFSAHSPAGPASMTIDQVEIYPSGRRIVLALHVSASLPRKWVKTKGWLYVTAVPLVDLATQTIRMSDLRLTRELDSRAVSALEALLNGPLQSLMEHRAVFDLEPLIDRGRGVLKDALAKAAATKHVDVSVSDKFVGVRSIKVGADALTVVLGLDGTASVTADAIPIALSH